MRYVNGGTRYKAGTVPSGPVPMFSLAGSVTSYASPPDRAPSYPAWPGSPAASALVRATGCPSPAQDWC